MSQNLVNSPMNYFNNKEYKSNFSIATKFEKSITILLKVKKLLQNIKAINNIGDSNNITDMKLDNEIISDLDWVIENIVSQSLFDMDFMNITKSLKGFKPINNLKKEPIDLNESKEPNELNIKDHKEFDDYFRLLKIFSNCNQYINPFKNLSHSESHSKASDYSNDFSNNNPYTYSNYLDLTKGRRKRVNLNTTKEVEVNKIDLLTNFDYERFTITPDKKQIKKIKSLLDKGINKQYSRMETTKEVKEIGKEIGKENNIGIITPFQLKSLIQPNKNSSKYPKLQYGLSNAYAFRFNYTDINFNIFEFSSEVGRDNVAPYIFNYIIENLEGCRCNYNQLREIFHIDKEVLNNLISEIVKGYDNSLAYHNDLHALDVCQTLFAWLNPNNTLDSYNYNSVEFSSIDFLAIYTSALIHDFKHPGFTNNYLVNSKSELAINYNDKSVLENWHIAEAFKIILRPENNIFNKFSDRQFVSLRKKIIDSVLATDMSNHVSLISSLKGKLDYLEVNNGENINKLIMNNIDSFNSDHHDLINFLVHSADISHNTKVWKITEI